MMRCSKSSLKQNNGRLFMFEDLKQVDDSLLKSHHEESEKGLDHKENVNFKACSSQL